MSDATEQLGDAQLLHDLQAGDEDGRAAFAELYRRYLPMLLLRVLIRLDRSLNLQDREDLAQQVFVELWRNRSHFRRECSIGHYLIRIAGNLLSKHRRSEARRGRAEAGLRAGTAVADKDKTIQYREAVELVHHALALLPEAQRQVVSLVCLQGRSIAEAAQIVRCSAEKMKSRYRRGKSIMEQHLRGLA